MQLASLGAGGRGESFTMWLFVTLEGGVGWRVRVTGQWSWIIFLFFSTTVPRSILFFLSVGTGGSILRASKFCLYCSMWKYPVLQMYLSAVFSVYNISWKHPSFTDAPRPVECSQLVWWQGEAWHEWGQRKNVLYKLELTLLFPIDTCNATNPWHSSETQL